MSATNMRCAGRAPLTVQPTVLDQARSTRQVRVCRFQHCARVFT